MKTILDHVNFPNLPGTYGLFIHLNVSQKVYLPHRAETDLEPGNYLYAGSAKGPGGLRARIRRHLRTDKKPHWHIDRLTDQKNIFAVIGYLDLAECDVVTRALKVFCANFPMRGFGSSDCQQCQSHLLQIKDHFGHSIVAEKMRPDFIWIE